MTKNLPIIVIGAGFSGAVIAHCYATLLNKKVTVIEQRDHIGGNCYDYKNKSGHQISKYGPHYFHTNNESVWKYIKQFSEWIPFEAICLSNVDGKKVPIPVNIDTINSIFKTNIQNELQMKNWLSKETIEYAEPKNAEEAALRRVGKTLYEKMFKDYTIKQWDKHPTELDPSIMDRIPIRYDHEKRYFTDKYQAYPKNGYTALFNKIFNHPNITIQLNTSWDTFSEKKISYKKLFFTGRIDSYFKEQFGKLEYRSLRFEHETINQEFFQEAVQENYPAHNVPFTRIVEYKHQTKQKSPTTTIVREYPSWEGEPYYPVISKQNKEIYAKYQKYAASLENKHVYFLGRLANYKYFNMDQAILNAIETFQQIENVVVDSFL